MSDTGIVETPVETGLEAPETAGGMFDDVAAPNPATEGSENAPATETPEPGADVPAAEAAEAAEPGKPPLPSQVAKLLRELSEAHPDHAPALKQLRGQFFEAQEFKAVFPKGAEEARTLKASYESVGGEEGITELQNVARNVRETDESVAAGEPKIIDDIAQNFPEGFKRLVPHALARLERLDPNAYDNAIRGPLVKALGASGLRQTLARAAQYIQTNRADFGLQELQSVEAWLRGHEEAITREEAERNDPREAQLREAQQRERTAAGNAFKNEVARDVVPYARQRVTEALKPFLNGRKLTAEGQDELVRDVIREMDAMHGQEKGFNERWNGLMRDRNRDRILNFARSKIDLVASKAAKTVWTRRYGSAAPVAAAQGRGTGTMSAQRSTAGGSTPPANAGGPGTLRNPLKLPGKPPGDQIDWSKDEDRQLYITHRAWLKTGKFVGWQ